jgi:ribosomal subunit interface protein
MDLIVKNRNGKLTSRQRDHIEEKFGKLERHLEGARSMVVEISAERRRNHKSEVLRLQVTLVGAHGIIVRADQSGDDLFKTVDLIQDVLQRQIKRYKDKHWRRGKMRRKGGEFIPSEPVIAVERAAPVFASEDSIEDSADLAEEDPRIVRVKEFPLKPMYTDEAVEQMELLDHSFFVFRDADTSRVNIVYRRKDGHYGLLVPDEA